MTVVNCPSFYYHLYRRDPPTLVTWADLHDGAGTWETNYAEDSVKSSVQNSLWVYITRGKVPFDTSTTYIPAGATIISVVAHFYVVNAWVNTFSTSPSINIYQAPTGLDASDYQGFGTTPFCDTPIPYSNPATPFTLDFTLNAAGLAAINVGAGAVSYFAIRNSWDALDSPPAWQSDKEYRLIGFYVDPYFSGYTYLVVTYTLVTVATNAATNITSNSAQLNGTLTNDGAEVAYVSFDWGLTSSYGNSTLEEAKLTSGTFNKNIGNNLTPDTTYHFRAVARVDTTYIYGSDLTFRTGTPSGFPIRVTNIKHLFSAGPEPVYKAEVYIGGLQSSYLPPISDKEPLPSVPVKTDYEALQRLGMLRTGTAMSGQSALFQYGVWLSQHTRAEINAIFKHQPTFAEWWAWYQVYGKGAP